MWFKVVNAWYAPRCQMLTYLLWPLSFLFGLIIKLRRYLYDQNFLKTYHCPVPVVIVGNITVGGTGKTPFVIWLANFLKEQGYRPGIVSRGVGGKKQHAVSCVSINSSVKEVGDEALLLAKHSNCPVVLGINRVTAVKKLLQQYACDIVISDDGLQHYALKRDLEIVLVDGSRGMGNACLLPAGPLREPVSRLKQVDFVITHYLSILDKNSMTLVAGDLVSVSQSSRTQAISSLINTKVHAVAGIGNPDRFFQALTNAQLDIIPHVFPDHYQYNAHDLDFQDDLPIIMTEKDAIKCLNFATDKYWYWPVTAKLHPELAQAILTKINVFCPLLHLNSIRNLNFKA